MITPTKTYQCPLHKNELEMKWPHSEGFTYEIAAVRNCLLKGNDDDDDDDDDDADDDDWWWWW